jgi:hypothetical protein
MPISRVPGRGGELAATAGPALALTAVIVLAWLLVDPHTPDLAAQVYRVGLFERDGFAIWDNHWYAGHHLPGYSLLFPALGSLLGVSVLGAICVPVSVALFATLLGEQGARAARWSSAAFAVAAAGDVWLGRLAFALGVTLALAAGVCHRRGHPLPAVALAVLAAAASPVAGLLLGLAALTVALWERSPRPLAILAVPGAAVVVPLALLFGEGGFEPFPFLSFLASLGVTLAFLVALPRGAGLLRVGGLVYLAACVACLLIRTPIGSNVERYGVLLACPLLLSARLRERGSGLRPPGAGVLFRTSRAPAGPGLGAVGAAAVAAIAVWVLWGPVRETVAVDGSAATRASYYRPLVGFLDRLGGQPVRIEVPMTRSHWEAALLAPRVSLARGWEKQLDERYDRVLLAPRLSAGAYRAWLDREAVAYVALPDAAPDPSSAAEGRLIRAGLAYLRPVFHSAHWLVYAVQGATPLLSGPGQLTRLGADSFTLRARGAGTLLVRVHFTRYWTLTAGIGCVGEGPGGLTEVRAGAPGPIVVAARFSLSRALGSGGGCRGRPR